MDTSKKLEQFWAFIIFYLWIWIDLFLSIMALISTIIRISKSDMNMAGKLFSSIGLFAITSLLCWIPRTLSRVINFSSEPNFNFVFASNFFTLLCGILYALIFAKEKSNFYTVEREKESDINRFSFSWEIDLVEMEGLMNKDLPTSSNLPPNII